jgi:hypothetical protein
MTPRSAFLVEEVRLIGDELWLVRGRAYATVRVGDVLSALPQLASEPARRFKVESLSIYNKTVDALTPMLTGDLTLSGPNGDILKATSWLVL